MSGNEASAIGSLRAINSAESTYSSSCGGNGYAQTLADLYAAPAGSTAGFISPDLNANGITKSGYVVNVAGDTGAVQILAAGAACNNNTQPALSAYFARARMVPAGESYTIDTSDARPLDEPGTIRPRSSAIVVTAITPCPHMVL